MKNLIPLCLILLFSGNIMAQNVGIGTSSPSAKLHVNGSMKISDGTQGNGKVLTSDANGMATWQMPSAEPVDYPAVGMCCQTWMAKNLDVATYRNGDPIPKVTNAAEWAALNTGAYCYYNNDSATYAAVYGKLYNWYAVNDPRGLAPAGWHIPSLFELETLESCLGGEAVAGGQMKETGIAHWTTPNSGATNNTNFRAVAGGTRAPITGAFGNMGTISVYWSTKLDADGVTAWCRSLSNSNASFLYTGYNSKFGLSVRCIKD